MTLKAVIFDLDGTLADTLAVCIQSYQYTFDKFLNRRVPADEIEARFGRSEEGILADFIPEQPEALLAEYILHYKRLHEPVTEIFPGMPEVLDLLHSRGIAMAIVTGKGQYSAEVSMRALGLDRYFDRVEIGAPDYNNKTENIRRILSDWGIDPAETAYVGDTIGDMHAAADAGTLPLGAGWGETATVVENDGAAHVFRSVGEFKQWIEEKTRAGD